MDFKPFNLPFGAPTDLAYLRFLEGLKQMGADPGGKGTWRWHGRDEKWYVYDPAKWGMEDFGAPDTPPESAFTQQWGAPRATWTVNELSVPDLFARLQKAYATLAATHPQGHLVWTPWGGGDWRSAFERPAGMPHPPQKSEPPTLPGACMKRIEDVQAYERSGVITHAQAAHLIEKIVAECT